MDHIFDNGRFTMHFTSQTQLSNFGRDREAYRDKLESSLTNRFKMRVYVSQDFADLVLYHRISTKLFLVVYGDKQFANMQDVISVIGIENL